MRRRNTKQRPNPWEVFDRICKLFLATKNDKKEAEIAFNAAKAALLEQLGDNRTLCSERYAVVYATSSRTTLDVQRLKIERPDIYNAYLTESKYSTLSVDEVLDLESAKAILKLA